MRHSCLSAVSLPFLPNLLEMEFLGLSFDKPFGGVLEEVDVELLLLLEMGEGLEEEWGFGFLFESLFRFLLLPEFLDSK